MYDSSEYAHSRLSQTLVRDHSGNPVWVIEVRRRDGQNQAYVYNFLDILTGDIREYWISLEGLNLEPIPLGFSNISGGVQYLARQPMRSDYRQGLRRNSLTDLLRGSSVDLNTTAVYNTIVNKYPKFHLALDRSVNECIKIAFSRSFAVDGYNLLYKWLGSVGKIDKDGNIQLDDKFEYLEDMLKEAIDG